MKEIYSMGQGMRGPDLAVGNRQRDKHWPPTHVAGRFLPIIAGGLAFAGCMPIANLPPPHPFSFSYLFVYWTQPAD